MGTQADLWADLSEADLHAPITTNGTAPAPPAYDVHILHRDNPHDWAIHPYVMENVKHFCENYERQGNPDALVENIRQAFVMPYPNLIVLVYTLNGELIGHMLCDRSVLYFKPIIIVHQYFLMHGIPAAMRKRTIEMVKEWGKDPGPYGDWEPCEHIQWFVRDKRLVPMYKRMFDARTEMLVMRTDVE